jgi:hypothetical protein
VTVSYDVPLRIRINPKIRNGCKTKIASMQSRFPARRASRGLVNGPRCRYLSIMPSRDKPTAEKLRSLRAPLLRYRAEYLSTVRAADERAAEAAAVAAFDSTSGGGSRCGRIEAQGGWQ